MKLVLAYWCTTTDHVLVNVFLSGATERLGTLAFTKPQWDAIQHMVRPNSLEVLAVLELEEMR